MNNILLDELPSGITTSEGNYFPLNFDFRAGIQAAIAREDPELSEPEKLEVIIDLLFDGEVQNLTGAELEEILEFYFSGWNHDNPSNENNGRIIDYDVDQWRIYSVFLSQYRINLNDPELNLHFWVFMGLLSTVNECSYSRVIDIRTRKYDDKMSTKERNELAKIKDIYKLRQTTTQEEKQFGEYIDSILQTPDEAERQRIEIFEKYGKKEG